jgi:3-hydroxyacyl-CoA dehydrogenase
MTMTDKLKIAVIGAGTMGRGIVQLFAQAGHRVHCFDSFEGAAGKAVEFVVGMIGRGVEKGRIDAEEFERIRGQIHAAATMQDLADCDVLIEAIVEDLEAKRALFRSLEAVVSPQAILASNTSSLVVAEIAAACVYPQRVAGLHFFNPVPLMKVAEVIAAVRTAPAVVTTLRDLVAGAGHRAVVAADQPGFLVNHAGRGLYTEGLRLLEEQSASVDQIDLVLREAAGFRMGPFELLDLTGLDVSSKVMSSIYEQFQQEPRFRPSSLVPPRVAAGLFGRKTGQGWYAYERDARQVPPTPPVPALPAGLEVWVAPKATECDALKALVEAAGARWVERPTPDARGTSDRPALGRRCHRRGSGTRARCCTLRRDRPAARPRAPSHPHAHGGHRAGHARRRARAVRTRRGRRHGDQRQPRLHRATRAGDRRQHRGTDRTARHRIGGRHRRRGQAGAWLSARSAVLGRPHWRCAGARDPATHAGGDGRSALPAQPLARTACGAGPVPAHSRGRTSMTAVPQAGTAHLRASRRAAVMLYPTNPSTGEKSS